MTAEALQRAANGARILEAVDNYARAGVASGETQSAEREPLQFIGDEFFWETPLPFGTSVTFQWVDVVLSEWVARVPGLFWTKGAQKLREEGRRYVERRSGNEITLLPFGKSSVVSGGVGTLRLPPSESGHHLCSVVTSGNVSGGVPVLIAPDVWEHHRLAEGDILRIHTATWQPMARTWSEQFPSTRTIPRAYLWIHHPDQLQVIGHKMAVQFHPFSIMQYYKGNSELYDFVFATGVTGDPDHRRDLEEFFETYKDDEGRAGRYLTSADLTQPMWDATYASPAKMAQAQNLVQRRIEDAMIGENTTEYLLDVLTRMDVGRLKRISSDVGISPATWYEDGSLANESLNLLTRVPKETVPRLIDAIRVINPDLLEVA